MEIPKDLLEFEDGFAAMALRISINRRQAQDTLIDIAGGISRAEAHRALMNPDNDQVRDISLEYGYNLVVNGVGFAGYAMGPIAVGVGEGQKIAAERGSYDAATGLLTDESEAGARRYSYDISSYARYDAGIGVLILRRDRNGNITSESTIIGESASTTN